MESAVWCGDRLTRALSHLVDQLSKIDRADEPNRLLLPSLNTRQGSSLVGTRQCASG